MEPSNSKDDILELAIEWVNKGRRAAIATVVSTWGSASRQAGSLLIVDEEGAFEGSVSGGCVEPAVITEALDVINKGIPKLLSFGISDEQAWDVGLICGGRIDIYIQRLDKVLPLLEQCVGLRSRGISSCIITDLDGGDATILDLGAPDWKAKVSPALKDFVFDAIKRGVCAAYATGKKRYYIHGIYPATRLIIIGAVDIARVLAKMAALSNYSAVIIDPRGAFASRERFPDVELIVEWPDDVLPNMNIHRRTAIIALTHDPKIDDVALKEALRSDAFYIGALGSKKTHADRLERLRSEGFNEDDLARIHGPVGLDIGAKTHAEIATAILAEIIKTQRKGTEEDARWPLTRD